MLGSLHSAGSGPGLHPPGGGQTRGPQRARPAGECEAICLYSVVYIGPSWVKLNCQTEGQRVDFVWEMSTKVPCSGVKQVKNVLYNPESHCILFTQRTNSLKQRIQRERQRWRMRRRSRSQCF